MVVNSLVTGLIVFKILKVFLEVKATLVGRMGLTGSTKLRHVIFVIIESGIALFSIQLVRITLCNLPSLSPNICDLVVGTNQMFFVI